MAQENQPLKENLAAEAFRRNYAALQDALAPPGVASGLAAKLYSGAIITLGTRDAVLMPSFTPTQQANWLLQAVESSIKIDHSRLRKFTRVLRKQPVLVPIAKQLRQCYRELVSQARLTESSSSGSDTDSIEQHQSKGEDQQDGTMTGQSYSKRSSLPTAKRACRNVSPQRHLREEECSSKPKSGIMFTGTSAYEEWCCRLYKSDGDSQDVTASGVIVQLKYPPEVLHTHLPGLRPMKKYPKEYGSVETSYMLITCHHMIPGMSFLKGWSLNVGLGRKSSKLESLVCGAVSCCGENGLISSGPLKPTKEKAVFSPHPNGHCCLDLDFTILFLNPTFEKFVLNRKRVKTSLPEIILTLLKADHGKHQQLQLYQREQQKVVPIPLSVRVQPQDSSLSTLTDEIKVHKTLQVIDYTHSESQLTQCCSGSPLVSCDPYGKETLVGIHIKAGSNCDGCGITIYGIFQMLKGQLAAFFALMERHYARRKWPFRWDHLLIHTLESDVKEKPLSYLLEILHHLLTETIGIRLIEFRNADTSLKLKSGLELLSALFKQFGKYGREEISEAVSGMLTVEITENQFGKELQQLSESLVDLLHYLLDTQDEIDLVIAYFVCYNWVLKFEYKGTIQAVLSRDDVTKDLQHLRDMYSLLDREYVIERNFHDILLQLMKYAKNTYEFQIQKLTAQNKELEARLQRTWQELQRTKCTLRKYDSELQRLQKLQEIMKPDRRQSS